MKRRFILYMMIGLIFKSSQLLAQSEKPVLSNINSINAPNSIGLAIGLNTGAFQDIHFSPLIYQEIGPAYNLNYRKKKENKRRLWTANLFFSNGKLTTEASDLLECRYIIADIEVACLKQLNETKEKFDFYIGAGYHLDFGVVIFNDVLQSFTFLVAHSLDLKGQVNYELNEKNELLGSLSLPLATLLVRPPYSGYDDELDQNQERPLRLITNGGFVTFNKYAALNFNIKHRYQLSSRWTTQLIYAFNYQHHSEFKQFQNQAFAGLIFQF